MRGIYKQKMVRLKTFVNISDKEDYDSDIDKITAYCERCASFGFENIELKELIYLNNEL
jgi:hypothetical protein